MPLYLVGAGISARYLTLRAIQLIGSADIVYIDTYTSIAPGIDENLVARLNPRARIIKASRELLEQGSSRIIEEAQRMNVVVLVPGDPLHATTHIALLLEARQAGVDAEVVPGVSGLQAVIDATGLQVYRCGRPVTLVYPEEGIKPYSTVEVVRANRRAGLHTMILLDLRLDEKRAMTVPEAVELLIQLEEELAHEEGWKPELRNSIMVGVARAGLEDGVCIAGLPEEGASASYPPPPHTLIVTAPRLHPMECEALKILCGCRSC